MGHKPRQDFNGMPQLSGALKSVSEGQDVEQAAATARLAVDKDDGDLACGQRRRRGLASRRRLFLMTIMA
jgi:hypothetical protein